MIKIIPKKSIDITQSKFSNKNTRSDKLIM